MGSISRHITPLVITSLGGRHTHTHTSRSVLAFGRCAPGLKKLRYYYSPLIPIKTVPMVKSAHKARREEELSKSKVSSLWSPFIYMLIAKRPQLGHASSYQLLITTILLITPVRLR